MRTRTTPEQRARLRRLLKTPSGGDWTEEMGEFMTAGEVGLYVAAVNALPDLLHDVDDMVAVLSAADALRKDPP